MNPGSRVFTNKAKCYANFNEWEVMGFEHRIVNHSVNYVDPETGNNTNTVEKIFNVLKGSIPRNARTQWDLDTYIYFFMFESKYSEVEFKMTVLFIIL